MHMTMHSIRTAAPVPVCTVLTLTLDALRLANCHTNILKLVITKFLRLVFIHSYFTAAFYIINIIYLPALYSGNIPQIYDNVMHRKGLLWMRLPSSELRGRISPWISPVHQQNRFPKTILWYLQYSTFYST